MALIRFLRGWLAQKTQAASYEPNALAVLWWPVLFVLLPVVALLVLVGLVYELIIRIDRARLDEWTRWTVSVIGVGLVVLALGWWLLVGF